MVDFQTEHAYQKQPTIFENKASILLGETGREKVPGYYRNIGLAFKTLRRVTESTHIDKKCPFTSNVSIQGQILPGVVTKMEMKRTTFICQEYLYYIREYICFEKCPNNMSVHLSACFGDVQNSDIVTMGECLF